MANWKTEDQSTFYVLENSRTRCLMTADDEGVFYWLNKAGNLLENAKQFTESEILEFLADPQSKFNMSGLKYEPAVELIPHLIVCTFAIKPATELQTKERLAALAKLRTLTVRERTLIGLDGLEV